MLLDEEAALSPVQTYQRTAPWTVEDETKLTLKVLDGTRTLVSYTPLKREIPRLPDPAEAAKDPEELMTCEELYLTGLHIEQYRHATCRPDPYYLEGLKRDPGDIRLNNAYGALLLRRGQFARAEGYFRRALERCTWKNPNPYDSEPYYNLGLALFYQDRLDEAFDAFYKAAWTSEQQEMGFYYLGCIEAGRGNWAEALELAEKGLVKNWHNVKARGLKAYLLRKLGREEQARTWIGESLAIDPFDYLSRLEGEGREAVKALARDFHETWLRIARDYAQFGAYAEAIDTLELCEKPWPMLYYYKAYYQAKLGRDGAQALEQAEGCPADYCFPNKLEDLIVLEYAKEHTEKPAKACCYLGCLLYDKLQYDAAVENWEQSARLDPRFPTVWRNLSLAYYNKRHDGQAAREAMERAWALAPQDARVFLELDQLYKKLGMPVEERLAWYEANREVFLKRDDLKIEYAALLNLLGRYGEAYDFIMAHRFHPWEGGEGKVTGQYTTALVELARAAMAAGNWEQAEDYLLRTASYPENLGEGKLEGTKDNHVNYYLGLVREHLGNIAEARACFERAAVGTDEPAGMMYYNDQPADMIYYQGLALEKLGRPVEAKARFNKLLDYGERHMFDHMRVSYFAVSLPDFLIFDDDLDRKNRAHCQYLIGLARLGLGQPDEAAEAFDEAIRLEQTHQNAIRYRRMCG